jgi:hypothetical protein
LFCTSGCRTAFHSACRRWTERAIASGLLTLLELRNGDPAACTLLWGRIPGVEVSEHGSPAASAPAARPGDSRITSGEAITVALDRMTAMQLRELTWGDPHHSATLEDLAKAAGSLLSQSIQVAIMAPSRRR